MTTKQEIGTAELSVTHDYLGQPSAVVVVGATTFTPGQTISLDDLLAAAMHDQPSPSIYREILRDVAPRVVLRIRKHVDGDRDAGCCWLAIELLDEADHQPLTTTYRLTDGDFCGWAPADAELVRERLAILRRASAIGLAKAQYGWPRKTVSDFLTPPA